MMNGAALLLTTGSVNRKVVDAHVDSNCNNNHNINIGIACDWQDCSDSFAK
jgi:hypothetical protein